MYRERYLVKKIYLIKNEGESIHHILYYVLYIHNLLS